MTTVVKQTSESTSSAIDQTFTISDLSSVNSVTVNNGSVTYDAPVGTSVTVHCRNGTSTRYTTGTTTEDETKYQPCNISQKYQWPSMDYAWYEYGSRSNNAPQYITASDGVNTLTLNSVTEDTSPRPPSANGSYDGQVLTGNAGSGTATYKGKTTVTGTTYYYQYNVTIDYNPIKTTYGTIELVSANENTINVRIKDLEYGSGYSQLVISMGGTTIGVSIAGTDGISWYSSTASFTGLSPSTSYSFVAKFTHIGENAGTSSTSYSTTAHVNVAPTLNFSNIDGLNAITATFSGYDEDGLRASNTYELYISGADDTTFGTPVYYTDARNNVSFTYSFSKDRLGNDLVANKNYTVKIILYDSSNLTASYTRTVKHTKSRPTNFAWTTAKTAGAEFNLTAIEWNGFITKINNFRAYKGIALYGFTPPVQNNIFTATIFNEAVVSVGDMNPSTAPPATKIKNDIIYASYFNTLRDSLNSIT